MLEGIDRIDLRILDQLQQDCTLSMAELAERVGLSSSPCWRRIRRMQEAGIIKRQVAQLDREQLGLQFVVYAYVKLANTNRETLERFEANVSHWPEVVLCELMTGAADYLIKVVTADVRSYDRFLRDKLLAETVVADVQSRIVVHTVKETSRLPLPE
ncbi:MULTISPECIES: Lrp/AsnC family transcriptional regulator [Rhodomicrobium]|uniref:Lrp/AsnC family transcriptional regulator n=1 Tax=Rhodomicrobium TaxID=1068 RepID=UPI000B4A73F0|nr:MULTISPECIES: Lrp/AsnC family transcriptional regulator [Rhodomicrobium]